MKLYLEDGTEATEQQVVAWLAAASGADDFAKLSAACEELAGAFLTCGERSGLERFIHFLVETISPHREGGAPPTPDPALPWQQSDPPGLRARLVTEYMKTTYIASDREHVPAALDKIGSTRVLTHEERSGYPY